MNARSTPGSFERRDRYSWRWRLRRGALVTIASGACEALAVEARDATFPAGRVVYFLRCGEMVKIGWSDNVLQRQRTLELATGLPMELLATIPGGLQLEAFLHACFRKQNGEGEWFRIEGPVTRALASLASPRPLPAEVIDQTRRRLRKRGIAA
jgi:hypothetical protein